MIQQSEVPVLAIPRQASFNDFEQILFATECQDGDLADLQYVAELAEFHNISLLIMIRHQKSISIFKRRQTKEMSFYTEVPLLVIPVNN